MKVSVCIPVYNGAEYIGKAIESVLNQNYKEYELLIVDNHSTDCTLEEVERFSDPRIRLIKNPENYGMFENWNICLHEAQGEYIQILCADDFIEANCLAGKVRILDKYPDVVLVFSASNVVDAKGKILLKRRPLHKNLICGGRQMAVKSFRAGNIYGEPSNVMFRKRAGKKIGKFSNSLFYSSDWDYWLRLSLEGRVAYIDRHLTNFRVSASSTTSTLIKQLKQLKKDDVLLVDRIRKNSQFEIKRKDVWIHFIRVYIRLYAKAVFCLLNK